MKYNLSKDLSLEEQRLQDLIKRDEAQELKTIIGSIVFEKKNETSLNNLKSALGSFIKRLGYENRLSEQVISDTIASMVVCFPEPDAEEPFPPDLDVIILNLRFSVHNSARALSSDAGVSELINKAGSLC
jgi:hypothetical protein